MKQSMLAAEHGTRGNGSAYGRVGVSEGVRITPRRRDAETRFLSSHRVGLRIASEHLDESTMLL
jgi:hypothetical protein